MSADSSSGSPPELKLEPTVYRVLGIEGRIAGHLPITIEERGQRDGSVRWVVNDAGFVLNARREWEYEPLPSSRGDDFIARTRFFSPGAALFILKKHIHESEAVR